MSQDVPFKEQTQSQSEEENSSKDEVYNVVKVKLLFSDISSEDDLFNKSINMEIKHFLSLSYKDPKILESLSKLKMFISSMKPNKLNKLRVLSEKSLISHIENIKMSFDELNDIALAFYKYNGKKSKDILKDEHIIKQAGSLTHKLFEITSNIYYFIYIVEETLREHKTKEKTLDNVRNKLNSHILSATGNDLTIVRSYFIIIYIAFTFSLIYF